MSFINQSSSICTKITALFLLTKNKWSFLQNDKILVEVIIHSSTISELGLKILMQLLIIPWEENSLSEHEILFST